MERALLEEGHGTMSSWKRHFLKEAREPWVPKKCPL